MPSPLVVSKPGPDEYAAPFGNYISLISTGDILATLDSQLQDALSLLSGRPESDGDIRYAPRKWSVKEVWGHVCDTERIFSYRALRISRNDRTPLAGFEQDDYVCDGPFGNCRLADLVDEFTHIRRATLALFRSLDECAWLRRGIANQNEISVRALAYAIAGHELHHRRILQEKYL
jgi:hypothetical protein